MIKANMEIKVDNSNASANCDYVIDFIVQQTEDICTPDVHELVVAAEELVINIFQHAYEPGEEGMLSVECLRDPKNGLFQMVLRDSGKPFDPTGWGNGTNVRVITCGSDSKRIGLLIAKRYLPDMKYRREDGQNILTVTKRYNNEIVRFV